MAAEHPAASEAVVRFYVVTRAAHPGYCVVDQGTRPTLDRSSAAQGRREWSDDDWITCPRCEGQNYDRGSCGVCGNLGVLDENGERFHCDCRADDWVEGDNHAIRCETCGGYAGEPGTSIRVVAVDA